MELQLDTPDSPSLAWKRNLAIGALFTIGSFPVFLLLCDSPLGWFAALLMLALRYPIVYLQRRIFAFALFVVWAAIPLVINWMDFVKHWHSPTCSHNVGDWVSWVIMFLCVPGIAFAIDTINNYRSNKHRLFRSTLELVYGAAWTFFLIGIMVEMAHH